METLCAHGIRGATIATRETIELYRARLEALRRDMARSLHAFLVAAWPEVEPAKDFVDGPHIRLICDTLERVTSGEITRLVINVPPRTTKSTIVSVVWPAWDWVHNAGMQFLTGSHNMSLATRDALKCRRLIESQWYRTLFPQVRVTTDQNQKTRYDLDGGGHRIAFGMGSGVTGEGGDRLVIDDPHPASDGMWSAANRRMVCDTFDSELSTRLNDRSASAIVLIMQRLHELDLTGHCVKSGTWEHIVLPMEYDADISSHHDWRRDKGDLLCEERFSAQDLQELRERLGSYSYAGQYQQTPVPDGGGLFQKSWWRFHDGTITAFDTCVQSWDMTFKRTDSGSYVVGQVWGKRGADYYLLHQYRKRVDIVGTIDAMKNVCALCDAKRWPVSAILVEDKANGPAVIDLLRDEIAGLIPVSVGGSKEARASAVAPLVESGRVYLPDTSTTYDEFLPEASMFPRAQSDDQVDAMSQAINYLQKICSSLISYG